MSEASHAVVDDMQIIAVVLRIRIRGQEVLNVCMHGDMEVDIFHDPDTVDAVQKQPDSPYVRGPAMAPLTKVSVMAQVRQSALRETCDMGWLHVRNTTTTHQSPDNTRRSGIARDKRTGVQYILHLSLDVHPKRTENATNATNVASQPPPAPANSAHISSRHDGGTTVHEEPEEPEAPYGALHADVQAQWSRVTGTCKIRAGTIPQKDHWRVHNDRVTNGYVRIPYLGMRNVLNGSK